MKGMEIMDKNMLNLINEIDDIAIEVEISCSKAKTVIDYVTDFFLDEKPNSCIILDKYKEMGNLNEIVKDYLVESGKTINELRKLLEQLHDEYTKNSLSKA